MKTNELWIEWRIQASKLSAEIHVIGKIFKLELSDSLFLQSQSKNLIFSFLIVFGQRTRRGTMCIGHSGNLCMSTYLYVRLFNLRGSEDLREP